MNISSLSGNRGVSGSMGACGACGACGADQSPADRVYKSSEEARAKLQQLLDQKINETKKKIKDQIQNNPVGTSCTHIVSIGYMLENDEGYRIPCEILRYITGQVCKKKDAGSDSEQIKGNKYIKFSIQM